MRQWKSADVYHQRKLGRGVLGFVSVETAYRVVDTNEMAAFRNISYSSWTAKYPQRLMAMLPWK